MQVSDLAGKNFFISGGSSGIGLSLAKLAASLGANVLIFSVDPDRQIELAIEQIRQAGADVNGRIEALHLDVSDHEQVREKLTEAAENFGPPHFLFNSAGVGGAEYFEKLSYERFDLTIKVNLYGTRNTIATLLPFLKKTGGDIVNVASFGGLIGVFGYTAYAGSKFGVIGFSQALRSELKPYGINVSALCPGEVDTPMWREANKTKPAETLAINKNAGLISPDRVAAEVLKGAAAKKFLILPGRKSRLLATINRLAPWLSEMVTDRVVAKTQKDRR